MFISDFFEERRATRHHLTGSNLSLAILLRICFLICFLGITATTSTAPENVGTPGFAPPIQLSSTRHNTTTNNSTPITTPASTSDTLTQLGFNVQSRVGRLSVRQAVLLVSTEQSGIRTHLCGHQISIQPIPGDCEIPSVGGPDVTSSPSPSPTSSPSTLSTSSSTSTSSSSPPTIPNPHNVVSVEQLPPSNVD